MKLSKRFCSILLVLATLTSCFLFGVSANADTLPAEVTGAAGETVTVTFTLTPCYSTDGEIKYSNINLFEGGNVTAGGSVDKGTIKYNIFILSDPNPTAFRITLTGKIAPNAAVGSYCDITFTYLRTDGFDGNGYPVGPEDLVKTVRVKVIEKATPPPSTSSPTTTTQAPTTTTKAPTTTTKAPTTTTKAPTSTGLNFRELNNQISIAEGLNSEGYTAESWANLDAALKLAKEALSAKKQADINAAAQALKTAIASLVAELSESAKALTGAIQEVKDYLEKDKVASAYKALSEAITEAEAALAGGENEAIDAALKKLKAAFEAYKQQIKELSKTETVEVEKPVPTDPEGPFCNVRIHKVWLILMIISFILNLLFIALIVYYFIQKKKREEAKPEKKSTEDNSLIM